MADRLGLFNRALLVLGERQLASLSENRAPRRYLDVAWNGDALGKLLIAGQWKFAQRTVQMDADPEIDTQFGYAYAFGAPDDLVRTTRVCSDEFFNAPYEQYEEENGVYYASLTPFYLSYVSRDTGYGGDLAKWPPNFVAYAEHWLALQVVGALTGNRTDKDALEKKANRLLLRAQSTDAMEQATKYPPTGSWVNARGGGRGGWDRGNRNRLIG